MGGIEVAVYTPQLGSNMESNSQSQRLEVQGR